MIAVTGANGLLGRFIVEDLINSSTPFCAIKRIDSDISAFNDQSIEWRDADILDINSLQEALQGVTTVIHTAAIVSFNPRDGERLFKVNVEGTRNVVNTCLQLEIPRLIHISSVAALGRQKGVNKIDENHKWVDSKLNSEYAESKYLAELEVFRGQEEGLAIDIVNPSVILSHANWDRSSAQIFNYVSKNKPFYTNGSINYVDVRDVSKMILNLLQSEAKGSRIIANAGVISMKELLAEIAIRLNKKPPRILVPTRLVSILAHLELVRSRLTGKEPIVTPQSARSANEKFLYLNQKATNQLGITFKSLAETLDWCCPYYSKMLQ